MASFPRMITKGASYQISLIIGCGVVAFAQSACNRPTPTLDQIIEFNTKAVGGRAAIEAVQSIEVDLHVVDSDFQVDGIYRAARPGRMRIDIKANGKPVYAEGFNGERAWQWRQGGGEPVDESPSATAALRHGVEMPGKLFGLHELPARGQRLELGDREMIDGTDYYVLRVTFSDGHQTALYIDPKSWLITRRRDTRPLHPDIDPKPTTIETRSSDFRNVAGVNFAFVTVDSDLGTGRVLETTTVRSVNVNPSIDPSLFEKLDEK